MNDYEDLLPEIEEMVISLGFTKDTQISMSKESWRKYIDLCYFELTKTYNYKFSDKSEKEKLVKLVAVVITCIECMDNKI
jgi:hypothetical protein